MEKELKLRIFTAVFLVALVLLGVLYLPNPYFAIATLIVFFSLGGWEWSRLVSFEGFHRGLFVAWLLLFAYASYRWYEFRWVITIIGLLTWAVILVLLAIYERDNSLYKENKWLLRVAAFLVLIPAWISLVWLHQQYPLLVLYLIFLVAIADSGAYFVGKAFGKNKLAPELSPGKSREGLLGGLAGSLVWSILAAIFLGLPYSDWIYFILLSLSVALISVAGDLFESLLKREAGQKDSGNILPGHGGILDRIDGLLATLPLFTLGVFWGAIQV